MAFFAPLVDENPMCITEEVRFPVDLPARGQDSNRRSPYRKAMPPDADRSHAETND